MIITEVGLYQFTESWQKIEGEGRIPKGVIFKVHKVNLNGQIFSNSFSYSLSFGMPIKKLK